MNIERITCILIHSCLPGWYMDFDPLVPLAKRLRPFTQSPEFYAETLCTEMLDNFLVLATVPKSRKLVIKLESLQMQFEDTMKEVLAFLNVDFSADIRARLRDASQHRSADLPPYFTHVMTRTEAARILASVPACTKVARLHGYSLTD
eukprot:m.699322 g.699322  ORF g.699322 m.699322 type:complete len:148 (+) comp58692_c0_seq4:80-523(+)